MEQFSFNLLSGLLGALVGAFVTLYVTREKQKRNAIDAMISLVFPIGFNAWWKEDNGKPALLIHDKYAELWGAYSALQASLPFWKTKQFDKAWHKFMAIDYYHDIPNDQPSKLFQKGTHDSRDEVVKNSSEFIQYVNTLR